MKISLCHCTKLVILQIMIMCMILHHLSLKLPSPAKCFDRPSFHRFLSWLYNQGLDLTYKDCVHLYYNVIHPISNSWGPTQPTYKKMLLIVLNKRITRLSEFENMFITLFKKKCDMVPLTGEEYCHLACPYSTPPK